MSRRRERARWRIAYALNRLPWKCWPTLVGWALDGYEVHGSRPGLFGSTAECRADARKTGCCYCGKFRVPQDPPPPAETSDPDRPGDEDQFWRWRTLPRHIRRDRNAEKRAEGATDG